MRQLCIRTKDTAEDHKDNSEAIPSPATHFSTVYIIQHATFYIKTPMQWSQRRKWRDEYKRKIRILSTLTSHCQQTDQFSFNNVSSTNSCRNKNAITLFTCFVQSVRKEQILHQSSTIPMLVDSQNRFYFKLLNTRQVWTSLAMSCRYNTAEQA